MVSLSAPQPGDGWVVIRDESPAEVEDMWQGPRAKPAVIKSLLSQHRLVNQVRSISWQ